MNPEKGNYNENEALEKAEYDRDIRIAEQRRFENSLRGHYIPLDGREARLADIEIYRQGRLEF